MSDSDAGKGDDNRSDSKAYRDNYQNVDRSTPPKAINPNKPQQEKLNDDSLVIPNHGQYYGANNANKPIFKAGGIIKPSNEFEGMKPIHGSGEVLT